MLDCNLPHCETMKEPELSSELIMLETFHAKNGIMEIYIKSLHFVCTFMSLHSATCHYTCQYLTYTKNIKHGEMKLSENVPLSSRKLYSNIK